MMDAGPSNEEYKGWFVGYVSKIKIVVVLSLLNEI